MLPCTVFKLIIYTDLDTRDRKMELYNSIIENMEGLFGSSEPKRYAYNPEKSWADAGSNQLIMLKESAFELGGDNKPAVNYSCVSSGDYVTEDEILVYGKDLNEISGSVPFARVAIIKVADLKGENEEDTEPIFRAIQEIDFVKYRVYPKGYMVRSSADNFREQVRVSKEAKNKGITFEQVGNLYIRHFKKDPNVLNVRLVFLTAEDAKYDLLHDDAKKTRSITRALSKILEGMSTDCNSCNLKSICDEVEGMRELHFGQNKPEFKG